MVTSLKVMEMGLSCWKASFRVQENNRRLTQFLKRKRAEHTKACLDVVFTPRGPLFKYFHVLCLQGDLSFAPQSQNF